MVRQERFKLFLVSEAEPGQTQDPGILHYADPLVAVHSAQVQFGETGDCLQRGEVLCSLVDGIKDKPSCLIL